MTIHDLAARALRRLDPEDAHRLSVALLRAGLGPHVPRLRQPRLETEICGLKLDNPIGLAAGFDKDAAVPDAMLTAGFGFVECGTVTPLPQSGNPRPRLFRLSEDEAVINRMGFNNAGLEAFAGRLAARSRSGVVGANIGANKDSEDRIGDYVTGLERLWPLADYFTVNVSSPNTPGLRALQTREALSELLGRLSDARAALTTETSHRPVFLKVAPDLDEDEVAAIAKVAIAEALDGVIVSNTTLFRPHSLKSSLKQESGGLSGRPLSELSTRVLGWFHRQAAGRLTLIGVGGIGAGADAYAKIRAGAAAVQLYSAMVFKGPGLVWRIRRDLETRLAADGFGHVSEAVGADHV